MWADGKPAEPSPTIDQAVNGGYQWLEIESSRCKTKRDVDIAALSHPPTTFVHDLASRLRCSYADIGIISTRSPPTRPLSARCSV